MLGKNGSAIKYLTALSPVALAVAGSTGVSNLAGFEFGTLIVSTGSAASGTGYVVNVMRSGTSNGTFASFGASLAISVKRGEGTYVRSFTMDSSAVWHRVSYDNNNGGSVTAAILLALDGARSVPVNQEADVVVSSDVLGG